MKKHLHNSLRALFLSLSVLLSLPMLAESVEINGINYDLVTESKEAAVIALSGEEKYSGEIVILESFEHNGITYSVTSIGELAFIGCYDLTSVTIPNSVTSIGNSAFSGCDGLTEMKVDANNSKYDSREGCNAIIETSSNTLISGCQTTVIPNSVTSIGSYAFYGCSGLTSVTIPNSVTSIGNHAFINCSGLTSVTIPNSVTNIGEFAFFSCYGLTSVHISDIAAWCGIDFSYIHSNPLYYAGHLYLNGEEVKDLLIPNSMTSIGDYTFSGCDGLTSVTIPNSVTSIGYGAFDDCSGLTSVNISDIVAWCKIDFKENSSNPLLYADHLYLNGEEVKDLLIPNRVTSIGWYAFYGFDGLTSVTIPNSVTSIGSYAFSSCYGLTSVTIPNSVKDIGVCAFTGCDGLTSVTIPNNVTSIKKSAFAYCSGLTSVTIPNSVTSIGDYAFDGCSGLTSVTIPNSVTSIGDYAFRNCSSLTSVTIPNNVTSIGSSAFSDCSGLTSVTILNNVTSIKIYTFFGCSSLTSVTIGSGVENIYSRAFAYCPELLDVYCYAENVPSTISDAFDGSYPENATLHVPAASIESYNTTEPWSSFGTIKALPQAMTLVDGEVYDNDYEQALSTLTYTRTLPNMLWNPLYVPFKIPYEALEENYEVAYINAMHSYDNDDNGEIDEMIMEIVKIKAGTLKPNHPYLIKAKNEEAKAMSIVQENVTLYPAEITTLDCSSVYTKFTITGTYQEMTSDDLNGSLIISTDGAWKKLASTSILKPFRFYLTISSREGSPVEIEDEAMSRVRIRVMGEEDNATGIDEVKTEDVKRETEIYDLSGRRVSAPAKGGVYIINGKKVIY